MATISERPLSTLPERKRAINRRLAAFALTGAIAASGFGIWAAGQQGEQNRPEPTPFGGVGNPNESKNPSQENTPKPDASDPEVGNYDLEKELRTFGVNTWLDSLSSSQKTDENDKFFNLTIENKEAWEHNIQGLNEGNTITDPLRISWLGGYTSSWANEGYSFLGHKVSGEIEFNNISVSSEDKELTEADLANGFGYKGTFTLSYAERFYNYYYEPTTSGGDTNIDNVVDWIQEPESQDARFSGWLDGSFAFPIVFKNGVWTAYLDETRLTNQSSPKDEYNEFLVPFDLFYTQACGPYEEFSCQIVEKNPPYK